MGLDHWLEFRYAKGVKVRVIQWRKWHELQTFIEELWRKKTHSKEEFNYISFKMNASLWSTVRDYIIANQHTIYDEADEEFAKEWIAENEEAIRKIDLEMENHPYMKLYYNSSW